MPRPGTAAPDLVVDTIAHGQYDLSKNAPGNGTLVVFYRGLHCPVCKRHIKEMDDRIGDFAIRGIRMIAISGDTRERAAEFVSEVQIIRLPVGHSLDMRAARDDWGLFLSSAREGTQEPAIFSEPGHFWIRNDGQVAFSVIHSLPFMRPDANAMLKAIDFAIKNNYPPRGAYAGELP